MLTKWVTSAFATDCWRPTQENLLLSDAFLFNEDRESVEKKKSSFAGERRAKSANNLYFHQYIYTYFICDAHLLTLWQVIIIFNFVQIVHNSYETIKYYASCFKQEKYYRNYIVFCRMVFKYFCFSFSVLKNMF